MPRRPDDYQLHVPMTHELRDQLDELARSLNRSKAAHVRFLVEQDIANHR